MFPGGSVTLESTEALEVIRKLSDNNKGVHCKRGRGGRILSAKGQLNDIALNSRHRGMAKSQQEARNAPIKARARLQAIREERIAQRLFEQQQ